MLDKPYQDQTLSGISGLDELELMRRLDLTKLIVQSIIKVLILRIHFLKTIILLLDWLKYLQIHTPS